MGLMQGSYSEYVLLPRQKDERGACFLPLPDDIQIEDAAAFFVDPFTAVGIFDTAVTLEGNCRIIVNCISSWTNDDQASCFRRYGNH
jgi:NADPH:quinone reductase-like Zn-dependent oxidoreductase